MNDGRSAIVGCVLAAASLACLGQTLDPELDKLVDQAYLQQPKTPPAKLKTDGRAAAQAADDVGAKLRSTANRSQAQMAQSMSALMQNVLNAKKAGFDAAGGATKGGPNAAPGAPGGAVSVGALNPNCPRTLSYLDGKLPRYADPDLQSLRQQIVSIDVVDALNKAAAQGYTPKAAVAATVQQAQQLDAALTQSEACVRAYSANPEAAISSLRQGTASINGMGNAAAACSGAYVASYYGAVGMREVAVVMACLTN